MSSQSTAIQREVGLRDVAAFFARNKYPLIASVIVFSAVAFVIALLSTPIYRSEVLMASNFKSQELGSGASSLLSSIGSLGIGGGLLDESDDRKNEALAYLQSRKFIYAFLEKVDALPVLFDEKWNPGEGEWGVPADEIPTLGKAYRRFVRDVLVVSEDKLTGLVTIGMEMSDPEIAAAWVNDMVAMLNDDARRSAIAEAEMSIEYLNSELGKSVSVDLKRVIYNLIEQQIESVMLANVRMDYAFRIIDPAVVSDLDDYIRPRRVIIVVGGASLGLLFGMFLGLFRDLR